MPTELVMTECHQANSTLLLVLEDHIITEVAEEDTVIGLWCKLKSLYMMMSLTNMLLLKQHMFRFGLKQHMFSFGFS